MAVKGGDVIFNFKSDDKELKLAMLQNAIDGLIATFYRQTLFAEYEYLANEHVAKNLPVNHEVLSNIMVELYKKYYGLDEFSLKEIDQYLWQLGKEYFPNKY